MKYELQNILSGKSKVSHGDFIQAILLYLRGGQEASRMVEKDQPDKHKETEKLIEYVDLHELWVDHIRFNDFISAGAEQRVFVKNEKYVLKLNDTIYYASWRDYFHNLLLNNFFFPDTAYQLLGFYREKGSTVVYAVVKQAFIKATAITNLNDVKQFLQNNGFENIRNHDYYNPKLGIILEDLHDENVLTRNDMLYFIDTVFYIKPAIFWK